MRRTLFLIVLLVGCGGKIAPSSDDASVDSNAPAPDTRPTPVPTEDPPPTIDATPPPPPPPSCIPGDIEARACGKCGKQIRTCGPSGWNPWKACEDEIPDAECSIGAVRAMACGNCGTQKDTCDPVSCTWVTGSCAGEGPCAPGDTETVGTCSSDPSKSHVRTCSDKCAWAPFECK